MSRTSGGVTTSYTWDAAAGLPMVLQDGTSTYVYGLDLISATDGGGAQNYFLYDGLGSTTEVVSGTNGSTLASYRYDVFGAIRSQTGTSANYWLFTGEQRDGGSNFYYLRARYYDPAIGRFLGQDPLPGGNLYAYAGNNPVNLIDRAGLLPGFPPITCFLVLLCGGEDGVEFVREEVIQPVGNGYIDINVTYVFGGPTPLLFAGIGLPGCQPAATGGTQIQLDPFEVHPYAGGGCGAPASSGIPSISLTSAPNQSINEGLGCGGQVSAVSFRYVGPTFQAGVGSVGTKEGGGYWEVGVTVGPPGIGGSATCYWVFPDITG